MAQQRVKVEIQMKQLSYIKKALKRKQEELSLIKQEALFATTTLRVNAVQRSLARVKVQIETLEWVLDDTNPKAKRT